MVDFAVSYFNRNVDVYIMDLPEPSFEGSAKLTFQASRGGKTCAGLQKLAQVYLITLLTGLGSRLSAPSTGTPLGNLTIGTSNIESQTIRHLVNISHAIAVDEIKAEQSNLASSGLEQLPDDESLASAAILNLEVADCSSVSMTVLLTSEAGTSVTFVVPLTVVP